MILNAIPIKIFHDVIQGKGQYTIKEESVLVGHSDPDGEGRCIGLVIKSWQGPQGMRA